MDALLTGDVSWHAGSASYHNNRHTHKSGKFEDEPKDHLFLDNLHSRQRLVLPLESDPDAGSHARVMCCFP